MKRPFGTLSGGQEVTEYLLGSDDGRQLRLLDLGAGVQGYRLVGSDPATEVMVGFDTFERQQQAASAYFGAVVGRYANRLAGGRFSIDGTTYQVTQNEGSNALHGGVEGFDARVWTVTEETDTSISFQLVSPDGDQGFPGELTATATYTLLDDGFALDLSATTDKPTVCCLTSHAYINLAGGDTAMDHMLQVEAGGYVPIDAQSIPLGRIDHVDGTPFDLRSPVRVGDAVRTDDEQIALAKGIDHSFDVDGSGLRRVARVSDPKTGRVLELVSDAPALQVYTGNFLDGAWIASSGKRLRQGDALALEPHNHPDTPNQPWDGDAVLRPGERFSSRIEYHITG